MEPGNRFLAILRDGERLVARMVMQAHGTRYQLKHDHSWSRSDVGIGRARYDELSLARTAASSLLRRNLSRRPLSIEAAMKKLNTYGFHGAIDPVKGLYGEFERTSWLVPARVASAFGKVDFLVNISSLTRKMAFTCRR